MNGKIKWHKPTGPAFNVGEQWTSGNSTVTIVSVRKYPGATTNHISDYGVTYAWRKGDEVIQHEKDAWNFQVRYGHISDRVLKCKK